MLIDDDKKKAFEELKKKAYKELNEIKPYFEERGFKMLNPRIAYRTDCSIASILRTSGSYVEKNEFGFGIVKNIKENKYRFEYWAVGERERNNLKKIFNENENKFPNARFFPGKKSSENQCAKIRCFDITDPRVEAFNIIERTRNIFGF